LVRSLKSPESICDELPRHKIRQVSFPSFFCLLVEFVSKNEYVFFVTMFFVCLCCMLVSKRDGWRVWSGSSCNQRLIVDSGQGGIVFPLSLIKEV
jgi:hypothetical protein